MSEVPGSQQIILAVDTSSQTEAVRLAYMAADAGARYVKFGLQYSSEHGWRAASELAAEAGLDWVADAKLDDIPNTVVEAVNNLAILDHPPFGITMHTTAGKEAMRLAQAAAGDIKMLGVTVLTSLSEEECRELFGDAPRAKVMQLARYAAQAGLKGIVASPLEVGLIKHDPETAQLFAMIPGTRSTTAGSQDQARVSTPGAAIRDGADLLVIGRQITQATDPANAYQLLVEEIEAATHQ